MWGAEKTERRYRYRKSLPNRVHLRPINQTAKGLSMPWHISVLPWGSICQITKWPFLCHPKWLGQHLHHLLGFSVPTVGTSSQFKLRASNKTNMYPNFWSLVRFGTLTWSMCKVLKISSGSWRDCRLGRNGCVSAFPCLQTVHCAT